MTFLHFDEAKAAAEKVVRNWLRGRPEITKVLLIGDLIGKLRVLLWSDGSIDASDVDSKLREECGVWWSGDVLNVPEVDDVTQELYLNAWEHAQTDAEEPRLRMLDRHRSRTGWFTASSALWDAPSSGPPLVVFYSFKGGFGRSTMLASFAMQRANAGERVCVLDFDLDSPGVGLLLAADAHGLTARWGVVDFLLEQAAGEVPLVDYFHRCDRIAGDGEVLVFPAGRLDEAYADKLARVDLEEVPPTREAGLGKLLHRIRDELKPDWILLDSRTGISESAGQLLSGIANIHVLLGTAQDQSWQGLNLVLDRLGKERVMSDCSQAELILVQAMVPPGEAGKFAQGEFLARAEREFTNRYYAEESDDEDQDKGTFWDTRDMDSLDAPHVPVPVEYDARLASFGDVAEIAEALSTGPYSTLAERITSRFARETEL